MSAPLVSPAGLIGYDAAQDSHVRSTLIFPRNSRVEYNRWGRRRLLEKSRAVEANFPFVTRIKNKIGRGVAGKGIFPFPVTQDQEWNGLARQLFDVWASNPATYSIDASRDMWEDQRIAAEEIGAGDGEFFTALVNRDGMAMTQPLDPFEFETPWGVFNEFEDAVKTDEYLKPVQYSCRTLPSPWQPYTATWTTIPAEGLIHLFRRRRAKHLRGLPPLYSAMNDANDAMDWLGLEKATDKLHAALGIAKVIDPANSGKGITGKVEELLGTTTDPERKKQFENFWSGAGVIELNKGESLQMLTSNRPGAPAIEGIKLLFHLIALGADLHLSVVFSYVGLGGTPTRAEMEDAQNTFDLRQDFIVWRHSQRIYNRRLAVAQETGELRRCRDPYWWRTDWHGPAKITVDYGRSAAANIDLMKAGMLSIPRYYEERGLDPDTEMDKQIAWLKRAQQRCEEEGVDFSRFMEATPGTVTQVNMPESSPEE